MRVLVCGGRNFQDVPFLWRKLDELHARGDGIALVIEGGSDAVAGEDSERRSATRGFEVTPIPFQVRRRSVVQDSRLTSIASARP